jgi:hypothetical protein
MDIDKLVDYLTTRVVMLRQKYPKHGLRGRIRVFYNKYLIPWMEKHQLPNVEISPEEDEIVKNKILEMITEINRELEK